MPKGLTIRPEPLPETNDSLVPRRAQSLVKRIEYQLLNGAWQVVKPLLESIDDQNAIHGSVKADRFMAAYALNQYCKKSGDDFITKHNLTQIDKAMERATKGITLDGQPIDRKSRKARALASLQMSLPISEG